VFGAGRTDGRECAVAHELVTLGEITTEALAWAGGALVLGVLLGVGAVRALAGASVRKAKDEANRIRQSAETEASTIRDRAVVEAEKKSLAERERLEKDISAQRDEVREQERRIAKREDQLDRKQEALTLKEDKLAKAAEAIEKREKRAGEREREADELVEKQKQELLRVADLTKEQATAKVLTLVEEDASKEAAGIVRRAIEGAQLEAREKSREVILMACQRYASEFVAESAVRTVPIPSDDVKGRIIGREGRNIRAIQQATGADLIVDDTPGVIVVSCFDKVRQTIAAESLIKLIEDGRIHPTRIEEVVAQVTKDMDERILRYGREAVNDLKLPNVHKKVVEAMGRLAFRTSYGQNVLKHSIEVAWICQIIADQLGLDGRMAKRCGFLHDIGKAMDHEMEGTHPKIGAEFASRYGETDPVLNAIEGHHADVPATSFFTPIVMAADALSGARPGARRESLERYIQRLNQLQDIAKGFAGVVEAYAIQAGREVRVMVDAGRVSDDEAFYTAKKIADKVSAEMTFPGEIRITVLRETRAVEVAR
jgi:ribonuclease Y